MRATLLLPVAALLAVALASANAPKPKPTLIDPLPFQHEVHATEFARLDLDCIDCHAFGDSPADAPAGEPFVDESVPVNLEVCHACHRGQVSGVSDAAPKTCAICHPVADELIPQTHGDHWFREHASTARSLQANCIECHTRASCADCHETRGALTRTPHDVGFRTLHGIEARLDPNACSSCHLADSCSTCHSAGGTPW